MFIAFLAEAIGTTLLILLAHLPVLSVVLSGLVFFAWARSTASSWPSRVISSCST
jgi:hypothetical protein